ncbi:hypothetical protein HYH03_015878 [Edaphochlamys debaryana]|uniref:Elongator complex protein 1 n=1 Tax=Edaphochlamys debaryana TaxID=47281 RepID=A0A835XLD5_9CHLO|nr:hypothetical protein HYH03_015878 [Edaphochlamys debaryana]|eukprot:KAG2485392.1 hypothetical protein HYH03_015878 [Edaphochlamys debaryana]
MKNLVIEQDLGTRLELGAGNAAGDAAVAAFCVASADSRLYALTVDGMVHCYAYSQEAPKLLWSCPVGAELLTSDLDAALADGAAVPGAVPPYGGCWVASFSHVLELDALCIATRGGCIALLHVGEGEARELEQVGCVDDGLACLEWSPDGEVLAALSRAGSLLVMNQAWELLFEGPAMGAAAATAAAATAAAASGLDPAALYGDARLSWRGDGKFLAVVCRDAAAAGTATAAAAVPVNGGDTAAATALPPYGVRIWDRTTMEIHASGESTDGVLPLPAWQPNGRHLYVAASVAAPAAVAKGAPGTKPPVLAAAGGGARSPAVLLYERNGLRHGGFPLPSCAPVAALAWSPDSELLAVLTAPAPAEGAEGATGEGAEGPAEWCLQLWHRSNWHWYLKHERRYQHHRLGPGLGPGLGPSGPELGPLLAWDEAASGRGLSGPGGFLHVLTPQGGYEGLRLGWDVASSARGTAAVVDGCRVLLTPLRHGLVPPPMCAAAVELPEAAVDVSVGALPAPEEGEGEEEDEVVAVLTAGGRLALARSVEEDLWQETLEDQQALEAPGPPSPALQPAVPALDVPLAGGRRCRALCWLQGASSLVVLAAPYPEAGLEEGAGDVLVEVAVRWASSGPGDAADPRPCPVVQLDERPPVYAGGRVLRLAPYTGPGGGAAVELADGRVSVFRTDASSLEALGPAAALPEGCSAVRPTPAAAVAAAAARGLPPPPPLLGLGRGGRLCWGPAVLATSDVTSFAVRSYGPGGPALLYTSRKNLLYTVLMTQLASYTHKELLADPFVFRWNRREGEMQQAMHAAMRPDAATAAARDVAVRAVESGAALIAVPSSPVSTAATPETHPAAPSPTQLLPVPPAPQPVPVTAVLQMPRGNLEGVAPRGLVLAAVVGSLRAGDWAGAWRLAALQRLDLNLLVDYRWPSFLTSAAALVSAVPRSSDLCDLLFGLRPGSCLGPGGPYEGALALLGETEQSSSSPGARPGPAEAAGGGKGPGAGVGAKGEAAAEGEGKIAAVCGAVRQAVSARPDAERLLEVVVTSYARSDPPQLEEAMRCIRDAKERDLAAPGPPAAASSTAAAAPAADKALKHLLLYVDPDELYRTALGMYDMALAYMVVVNAQKDPGEAMSELQRFAAISPPALQRHAVDMSLRRYGKALASLVEAGPEYFPQALQLAKERGLLRQLLQLYDSDPDHLPAVLDAYGDHLLDAKRFDDAAVTFLSANQPAKALRAYRGAGRWQMVFVLAGQMEYDEVQVQELAAEVAEELAASGQAADAAAVLLSYLNDVDNAVRTYTQAREWREATRVSHAQQRPDLVETVVAPAAAEAAAGLLDEAREAADKIRKYAQRLVDVRSRREAMAAALAAADDEAGGAGPDYDAQSDFGSMVSGVTGLSVYTDATTAAASGVPGSSAAPSSASRAPSTVGGRKAHRQEKKSKKGGSRIRQGSALEEASLVSHLHSLAPRPSALSEAGQLLELLVLLGHAGDARTLQRALAGWQAAYQEAAADIAAHPPPLPDGPGHARAEAERLLAPPPDGSGVAWKWEVLRDFGPA